MINVLHLINYLGSGGSEKYIFSLAEKLHNKTCRFYLAYSSDGSGRKLFEDLGIELIKLDMKSPADLKASWKLKTLCKKLSIDVIHTHFLRENYIGIFSKAMGNRVKIINTRHMLFENSKSVIAANRLLTRLNDCVIAVSASVRDQLIKEGISAKKIKLIYNGVDAKDWSTACPLTFRSEYGVCDDEILVVSVARFSAEKGHSFLLDAVKYYRDRIGSSKDTALRTVRFVLAGSGELLDDMKEKAKELKIQNDVIFTGYRHDIKNILKSSDIFVSHSSNEALGISILEAMAAGLPVISTDSGGTREIVNDAFKSGVLIEYGDKAAFADSLIRLITDGNLRDRYVKSAYAILFKHFNLDKVAEETYNLYKS